MASSRPAKYRKLATDEGARDVTLQQAGIPDTLIRPISPPIHFKAKPADDEEEQSESGLDTSIARPTPFSNTVRSPFQLTRIQDLRAEDNVDTIGIRDLICDPMISEIWCFDYLFDPEWILSNLDHDTRPTTNLILIHGSWQSESENRARILDACSRHSNVSQVTAYLPDRFGTHHSKMMILFRHDDTAQVVIHTANMIEQDWRNMTQGVWKTGCLPKGGERGTPEAKLGSGLRLKHDLVAYIGAYTDRAGRPKLSKLIEQLEKYDFGGVIGALVASVPSRLNLAALDPSEQLWGWPCLRRVLRSVPIHAQTGESNEGEGEPEVVVQVSSIASLGPTINWFKGTLLQTLSECLPSATAQSSNARAKDHQRKQETQSLSSPKFSVIYPTPATIRRSLDGYSSGGSIHMRLDSPSGQKQLAYLWPYLHDWSPSPERILSGTHNAGRSLAAPHIKTYIRYCCSPPDKSESPTYIDWALLTSANLSTQAWGSAGGGGRDVWVQSYELGVLVWPALYREGIDSQDASMIAVFRKDTPDQTVQQPGNPRTLVGLRMPYSLPLEKYTSGQLPWCPTKREGYAEPDRFGRTWSRSS